MLTLDLGTSAIKAGILDDKCSVIKSRTIKFDIHQQDDICEVDFENVWIICKDNIVELIEEFGDRIQAILITSQAQTFVSVDGEFRPLHKGIVWLDKRAGDEAKILQEKFPNCTKLMGVSKPSSAHYVSKLFWLKRNRPEIWEQARYFPQIDHFIAYKLTGKLYADFTNFGMSGIVDIKNREYNREILNLLGIDQSYLPEIAPACRLGYPLRAEFGQKDVIVFFCGNDQSASAAGAGVRRVGDVSANFGTAMVVYTIIEKLPENLSDAEMVGINPITNEYFFLSFSEFGNIVDETKQKYLPTGSYEEFFAKFYGKDPNITPILKKLVGDFISHIENIEKVSRPTRIFVSGGATQSKTWLKILQENCKYELISVSDRDAGLVGAAKIYKMHN